MQEDSKPENPENNETNHQSSTPHKTLHITNLQRPFPLPEFKSMLATHGSIDFFWIDDKKSHAICSYKSLDSSIAALQALGNLDWPNAKKRILVNFLEDEDIEKTKQAEFVIEIPKIITKSNGLNNNDWASRQKKGQDISQIRGKQSKLALKDSGKNATKEDTNVQKTSTFFNLKHSRPEETVIELDKLFKKTKTIPCVYYLPVTEEVAKERKKPLK